MQQIINVLSRFNVELNGYQVNNEPRCRDEPLMVLAGGLEELVSFPKSKINEGVNQHVFSQALTQMKKRGEDVNPIEYSKMMPYTMMDGEFEIKKLQMLDKYKSVDKVSNEKLEEFFLDTHDVGYLLTIEPSEVVEKSTIETNLCYIFEKNPTTNTLAMARQFEINHTHIMEKVFTLVTDRPSLLNHIYWNVCKYEAGLDKE